MNFIIEHPVAFLGICAGLMTIGWQTWKGHRVIDRVLAEVIPIRPITHLHDQEVDL